MVPDPADSARRRTPSPSAQTIGSTPPRPRLRGIFHAAFFPVFVAAGIVLVVLSHSGRGRVGMAVYGLGLAACIGVSALYHVGHWTPRVRGLLGRVDHALIFALIAGTYTPIALFLLSGPAQVAVLASVWGGGLLGAVIALVWPRAPVVIEVAPYLLVGWVAVAVLPQLFSGFGWGGMSLVAGGGLLYTVGSVIYGRQWPDPFPRVFGYHEVFHSLTILAAAAHCVAIFVWILPRSWSVA